MQSHKFQATLGEEYFSAVETEADFFNTIGRLLPVATGRFWKTPAYFLRRG